MKLFPINYCFKSLVDYLVLVPLHYPWQGFWHIVIAFSEHKQISARILSSKRLIRGGKNVISPTKSSASLSQQPISIKAILCWLKIVCPHISVLSILDCVVHLAKSI